MKFTRDSQELNKCADRITVLEFRLDEAGRKMPSDNQDEEGRWCFLHGGLYTKRASEISACKPGGSLSPSCV